MTLVVSGLDAAHRAVGLPGSAHAKAALAGGQDVLVLGDLGVVELIVKINRLHEEGRRRLRDRCRALLHCVHRRAGGEHKRRRAGEHGGDREEDDATEHEIGF